MANGSDPIGEIPILITGDYSELQDAISGAVGVAQTGATQIADAFDVPSAGDELTVAIKGIGDAATEAADQMSLFGQDAATALSDVNQQLDLFDSGAIEATSDAFGSLSDNAVASVSSVEDAGAAIQQTGDSAEEAESSLAGMAEQLTAIGEALAITEGLKEFGEEALTAAGTVQSVTIGLTALTGSAEQANDIIEQIKNLAATEPFAFPEIAPTVQRMVALGVSTEEIPAVMQAAADAAAATGQSFGQVANSIDRMTLSGTAGSRQLVQIGVSAEQLATIMGVASDQFAAAFKNLDQSQRLDVLTQAMTRFAGTAEAEAQGIAGQWQIFQNDFEEVMVGVGNALAPVISDILNFSKAVLSGVQSAVEAFGELPKPVQDVVVVMGLLVGAAVPVTAGLAAIGIGLSGLQQLLPAVTGLFTAFGAAETEEAGIAEASVTAHTEAAAAIEAEGAAATTAAGEMSGAAVAAGTVTTATGLLSTSVAALGALLAGFTWGWFEGGAKDTAAQLQSMKTYADSLGVSLKGLNDASGNLNSGMNTLTAVLEKSGVDISNLTAQYQAGTLNQQQYVLALLQTAQSHKVLSDSANQAANSEGTLGAGFQQVAAQAKKLQDAYSTAVTTLRQVTIEFDNGTASSLELELAQKNLATAAAALNPAIKSQADSLAAVQQQASQLQAQYNSAADAVDRLTAMVANGTASTVALGIAQQNLATIQQKLNQYISDASGDLTKMGAAASTAATGVQAIYDKISQANTALQTAIQVYNQVRQATIDGTASQAAYNVAWNNLIQAFQTANPQLATAKGTIQDVGAAAMAAAQADASWTGANTALNTVIVNGQAVMTQAATTTKDLGEAATTAATEQTSLGTAYGTAIVQISDGTQTINQAVVAATNLDVAAQTLGATANETGDEYQNFIDGVAAGNNSLVAATDDTVNWDTSLVQIITSTDDATTATQNFGQEIVNTDGSVTNLTALLQALAQSYDAVATSADNAATAEGNAASAGSGTSSGGSKSGAYMESTTGGSYQESPESQLLQQEAGPFAMGSQFNFGIGSPPPEGVNPGGAEPFIFGDGGIVTQTTLGILGEDGPEAVIPLRGNTLDLMQQAVGAPIPQALPDALTSVASTISTVTDAASAAARTLTQAAVDARTLVASGLTPSAPATVSTQPSGGLTVVPDAGTALGATASTIGNTTTTVSTSASTGTPPIYKAGTGVVGTPLTLVSTDGGKTWTDAGMGNFAGTSERVEQLTQGGTQITDSMQMTVDGISLVGNSAAQLSDDLNVLGGALDNTTRAAAQAALGLGPEGGTGALSSALAAPSTPTLTAAQIQALNSSVSTIPGVGLTGGGSGNPLPSGPMSINISLAGAHVYGSQGAAQLGTALVNAIRQNASQLKF